MRAAAARADESDSGETFFRVGILGEPAILGRPGRHLIYTTRDCPCQPTGTRSENVQYR